MDKFLTKRKATVDSEPSNVDNSKQTRVKVNLADLPSDPGMWKVETNRDKAFPLVYLLIKLALTLPVATTSVERAFSAMHIVKNRLRNRMGDQWMNDNLVTYIEKEVFADVENEDIIDMFQKMKTR